MQKNHIGGIHIAKKNCVVHILGICDAKCCTKEYFRGHIQCVSGHPKESNDFDEKCHAGSNPYRNQSADGP